MKKIDLIHQQSPRVIQSATVQHFYAFLIESFVELFKIRSSFGNHFRRTFFRGLRTGCNCWGANLNNTVDAEEIRRVTHTVWSSLPSTCYTLSWWELIFFSSFGAVFRRFHISNVPITLYNILCSFFFLFLRCTMNLTTLPFPKYELHNNANRLRFSRFGWLSSVAVHWTDCWFDLGMYFWIHRSSLITYRIKKNLYFSWIAPNTGPNHKHVVVFFLLWTSAVPT